MRGCVSGRTSSQSGGKSEEPALRRTMPREGGAARGVLWAQGARSEEEPGRKRAAPGEEDVQDNPRRPAVDRGGVVPPLDDLRSEVRRRSAYTALLCEQGRGEGISEREYRGRLFTGRGRFDSG